MQEFAATVKSKANKPFSYMVTRICVKIKVKMTMDDVLWPIKKGPIGC